MVFLGTAVCRNCGKVFERKFGRQVYCCERCRTEKKNEKKRIARRVARESFIQEEISGTGITSPGARYVNADDGQRSRDIKTAAKFVSIKDAALLLGVSRPTIYRRIEAGEIHPVKVSSRTVRISVEDLIADSNIIPSPNDGDFSTPIRLEEALRRYGVSRSRFFKTVRKAGVRPKMVGKAAIYPQADLDKLFGIPEKVESSEWYSVEELADMTGMTRKHIRTYARTRNIQRISSKGRVFISRNGWDKARFSKRMLDEEFFTVDQAKAFYHIGQGRFYAEVNAAGIGRHRDGVFVYFRKSDLEKLFGKGADTVSSSSRHKAISNKR